MIVSVIDCHTCNLRQRDVQLLEVGLEVSTLVASTQFDEGYRLSASIKGGTSWKVIQLGKLWWSIGNGGSFRLFTTCYPVKTLEVWASLGTIIHSENAHNGMIKFIWDIQGTSATPVGAARVLTTLNIS